jgi:hypothetical protein
LTDLPEDKTITDADLHEFFGRMVSDVALKQRGSVSEHALSYVINLLVGFHETAKLFVQEGQGVPVLAHMMGEALEADTYRRASILRQLGDTSLLVSGYFPEAVSRRGVDLKYYKKMGVTAYSHLDSLSQDINVFCELSEKFSHLSFLINEVSEKTHARNSSLLNLLEHYMQTRSEHSLEKLKSRGVIPLKSKKKNILE